MRILITEDQLDYIKKFEPYKRSFFRFWNTNGGKIDSTFLDFFGFNKGVLRLDDFSINMSNLHELLREWHGKENSLNKAIEFLKQGKFTVNNCGGYNFDFDVNITEVETLHKSIMASGTIVVGVTPDLENGTVNLIMNGGETKKLKDAIEDEDYGWEIETEISECIDDFFKENITNTFGITILRQFTKYR